MAKRKKQNNRPAMQSQLNVVGWMMVLAVAVALVLIYQNLGTILLALSGTLVLLVIIAVIGAYFLLPKLVLSGLLGRK